MGNIRRFGIELECVINREKAARVISRCLGSPIEKTKMWGKKENGKKYEYYELENGWRIMYELDLRRDNIPEECSTEIITSILEDYHQLEQLNLVITGLKNAGAILTPCCGLHVHIDATGLTPNNLVSICKTINEIPVRKERNKPAKPIPQNVLDLQTNDWDELWNGWFAKYIKYGVPKEGRSRLHPARRRKVNLGSVRYRGTIEFRCFDSTLDYNTLKNRVNYIMDLIETVESAQ